MDFDDYYGFQPHVSVGARRAQAARELAKLRKKGRKISPVVIEGRTIAGTFWGEAWCDNLERYSDFANRLPRGRTYVRNGSVVDLQVGPGSLEEAQGTSRRQGARERRSLADVRHRDGAGDPAEARRSHHGRHETIDRIELGSIVRTDEVDHAGEPERTGAHAARPEISADTGEATSDLRAHA